MSKITNISGPLDVSRDVHVTINQRTGSLVGIPESWTRMLNTQLR